MCNGPCKAFKTVVDWNAMIQCNGITKWHWHNRVQISKNIATRFGVNCPGKMFHQSLALDKNL